jgi:hypothetical protein
MSITGVRVGGVVILAVVLLTRTGAVGHISFERGDIFISLEPGPVQWYLPDGTLRGVLVGTVPGTGEGMDFDPSGNLYVARWCTDPDCTRTPSRCSACSDSRWARSVRATTAARTTSCSSGTGPRMSASRAAPAISCASRREPRNRTHSTWWVDLAADGCTVFYTSVGPNVKRYDTCLGTQLPDFNLAPLPGGSTHDLRILPDGGVLVASGEVVARLDATGALAQTYAVPEENTLWAGLDLAGADAFWAANYYSSTIHKFDIESGSRIASFSTGTPTHTAVSVAVMR